MRRQPAIICACGEHAFAAASQWGVVMVSADDKHWIDNYLWSMTAASKKYIYAQNSVVRGMFGSTYLHHRIIENDLGHTDHKNGNGLDCRRCNLRSASHADNLRNARPTKNTATGYKGVSMRINRRPHFRARITVNRKELLLGNFYDPIFAALAYDDAARLYFGTFAHVNFPEENNV